MTFERLVWLGCEAPSEAVSANRSSPRFGVGVLISALCSFARRRPGGASDAERRGPLPGFCRCRHARRGESGVWVRPTPSDTPSKSGLCRCRGWTAVAVEFVVESATQLRIACFHSAPVPYPESIPPWDRWPRLWRKGCRALDVDLNPQCGQRPDLASEAGNPATDRNWISGRQDLNLRHLAPKASALPNCATPRNERVNRSPSDHSEWS